MMLLIELEQQIECFETLTRIYELLGIRFKGPDPTLAEKLAYLEMALAERKKNGINRTT